MRPAISLKALLSLSATGLLIFTLWVTAPAPADRAAIAGAASHYLVENGVWAGFENAVRAAKENNLTVTECHALMHSIGHAAMTKFGFKASAEAFPPVANACVTGFIHGALEEYFLSSPDPLKETMTACRALESRNPEFYERCVHGIGHGLLISTDYDLPKAVDLCHSGIPDHSGYCVNGVFMENFDANQEPGHKDYYLRSGDPAYPCAEQAAEDKDDCYFYAVDNFLNFRPRAYGALMNWCLSLEEGYRPNCIKRGAERIIRDNVATPAADAAYCGRLPDEYQEICFSHMAFSYGYIFGDIDRSIKFCDELIDPKYQDICSP